MSATIEKKKVTPCFIGVRLNDGSRCVENKSENDKSEIWEIISLRANCGEVLSACTYHFDRYTRWFPVQQKYCADPMRVHKKRISTGLVEVSLQQANDCPGIYLLIIYDQSISSLDYRLLANMKIYHADYLRNI